MQIIHIHVENFGKLHDLDLDMQAGLNRICEGNGWGKSTLAAFIKAMFYGLDYTTKRSLKENERKRYQPWQGGRFGGSLEFTANKKNYRVERSFGTKDKEDVYALYDLDTGLKSRDYPGCLGEELFRLNRQAFERSSLFMQQDMSVAASDSLNAGLARAEEKTGDMQNYESAVASLESRMKYFRKTGNRGQIGKLEEEMRKVREELLECRKKEKEISIYREQIIQKKEQEQKLLGEIQRLEAQIRKIRDYKEQLARKEQHDLLKSQAVEKEEELRKTSAELEQFTDASVKEEDLDRSQELLYRFHSLQQQEEEAEEQERRAEAELEQLNTGVDAGPDPGKGIGILCGILCGIAILAGLFRWFWLTVLLLAAAGGLVFFLFKKKKEMQEQRKEIASALAAGGKEVQKAKKVRLNLSKQREEAEERLRSLLKIPQDMDIQEAEQLWETERRKSREYGRLKQTYQDRLQESKKSREVYLAFCKKFSEGELAKLKTLKKPDQDIQGVQNKLERYRTQRERLLLEQQEQRHQVRFLEEYAEQIPELEEEEERLAGELEHAAKEHDLLEKTLKYLKTAREQFSGRYLKELQQGLEHYLELLVPESEIRTSLDVKLGLKVQEAGALRDLECFSAGWQDLLRIAERLAIVDVLYQGEQPMLILDDSFTSLDEEKKKRTEALLEKLSQERQILYFTCR